MLERCGQLQDTSRKYEETNQPRPLLFFPESPVTPPPQRVVERGHGLVKKLGGGAG